MTNKNNLTAIGWKDKKRVLFYLFVKLLLYVYDYDFNILFETTTTKNSLCNTGCKNPLRAKISIQSFFIVLIYWHYERQQIT